MVQKGDKSSGSDSTYPIVTSIIGAAALIGVAILGGKFEDRRAFVAARYAEELARAQAVLQNAPKILEFRLKQLELDNNFIRTSTDLSKSVANAKRELDGSFDENVLRHASSGGLGFNSLARCA